VELRRLQIAWLREWQPVQQQGMEQIAAASCEVECEGAAASAAPDGPAGEVPFLEVAAGTEAEVSAVPPPQDSSIAEVPVFAVSADTDAELPAVPPPEDTPAGEVPAFEVADYTEAELPAVAAALDSPAAGLPAFAVSVDTEAEVSAVPPALDSPTAEVPVCAVAADTEVGVPAAAAPQDSLPAAGVPVLPVSADSEAEGPAAAAADGSPASDAPACAVSADTEAAAPAAAEERSTAEVPHQPACEGAHMALHEARVRTADRQTLNSSGRTPAAVSCLDSAAVAPEAVSAPVQEPTGEDPYVAAETDAEISDPAASPTTANDTEAAARRTAAAPQQQAGVEIAAGAGCLLVAKENPLPVVDAPAPEQQLAHTGQEHLPAGAEDQPTQDQPDVETVPGDLPGRAVAFGTELLQTPADRDPCQPDAVDVETGDPDALPVSWDDVAGAAYRQTAELQNNARAALAVGAGCSRAVPQHAVALLASLRGSDVAVLPSEGGPSQCRRGSRADRPTPHRRRVLAAPRGAAGLQPGRVQVGGHGLDRPAAARGSRRRAPTGQPPSMCHHACLGCSTRPSW